MKVLHLNEHVSACGGIETYLHLLIPRLADTGLTQMVAFSKGDGDLPASLHRVSALSESSRLAELRGYRDLQTILSSDSPDVVHLHNVYNIGAIRACLETIPTVLTGHDYRYLCPASNFYYRRTEEICQRLCGPGCFAITLRKKCLTPRPQNAFRFYRRVRWMVRHRNRFAHVVCPSPPAMSRFARAGFCAERLSVIPYFCPLQPFDAPRTLPSQPTITFMGRINASKGYRYFLKALALLPKPVRGLMVGNFSPQSAREVHTLAEKLNCADRLELRPWAGRDAIREIMCETSVLIFPSLWAETLGIVGLEAMACGVPVVATDVGGVSSWLEDGRTGFLVSPKDEKAVASAVRRILDSRGTAEDMGRRGIAAVRQKFAPERHVEQLLSIYRQAIELAASGIQPSNVKGANREARAASQATGLP